MSQPKHIKSKISRLSPGLMRDLEQYLDYLLNKQASGSVGKLSQEWAGGLKDIHQDAVSLQKKALDWRQK